MRHSGCIPHRKPAMIVALPSLNKGLWLQVIQPRTSVNQSSSHGLQSISYPAKDFSQSVIQPRTSVNQSSNQALQSISYPAKDFSQSVIQPKTSVSHPAKDFSQSVILPRTSVISHPTKDFSQSVIQPRTSVSQNATLILHTKKPEVDTLFSPQAKAWESERPLWLN